MASKIFQQQLHNSQIKLKTGLNFFNKFIYYHLPFIDVLNVLHSDELLKYTKYICIFVQFTNVFSKEYQLAKLSNLNEFFMFLQDKWLLTHKEQNKTLLASKNLVINIWNQINLSENYPKINNIEKITNKGNNLSHYNIFVKITNNTNKVKIPIPTNVNNPNNNNNNSNNVLRIPNPNVNNNNNTNNNSNNRSNLASVIPNQSIFNMKEIYNQMNNTIINNNVNSSRFGENLLIPNNVRLFPPLSQSNNLPSFEESNKALDTLFESLEKNKSSLENIAFQHVPQINPKSSLPPVNNSLQIRTPPSIRINTNNNNFNNPLKRKNDEERISQLELILKNKKLELEEKILEIESVKKKRDLLEFDIQETTRKYKSNKTEIKKLNEDIKESREETAKLLKQEINKTLQKQNQENVENKPNVNIPTNDNKKMGNMVYFQPSTYSYPRVFQNPGYVFQSTSYQYYPTTTNQQNYTPNNGTFNYYQQNFSGAQTPQVPVPTSVENQETTVENGVKDQPSVFIKTENNTTVEEVLEVKTEEKGQEIKREIKKEGVYFKDEIVEIFD